MLKSLTGRLAVAGVAGPDGLGRDGVPMAVDTSNRGQWPYRRLQLDLRRRPDLLRGRLDRPTARSSAASAEDTPGDHPQSRTRPALTAASPAWRSGCPTRRRVRSSTSSLTRRQHHSPQIVGASTISLRRRITCCIAARRHHRAPASRRRLRVSPCSDQRLRAKWSSREHAPSLAADFSTAGPWRRLQPLARGRRPAAGGPALRPDRGGS